MRLESLERRELLATIASDGFESGNFSGGAGWAAGNWSAAGDTTVLSGNIPHTGTYHARLRASSGDLSRAVNVSGQNDVRLQFWSKVNSFEGSDQALVRISPDGSNWTTLQTFTSAQSDNTYRFYDLAISNPGSTLYVRFDAAMSATNDQWFIDDIAVSGSPTGGMFFNDPDYPTIQWGLNNTGQNSGTVGVDIDAPEAWSITTGSMSTVLAEIDDGVDFTHADIYLNIWLNQGEIPAALRTALIDVDNDGLFTFRDLNHSVNATSVSDVNNTGYIDGGDLLADPTWADGIDSEANGKTDDLVGWDFLDNDNDPRPAPGEGHGTGMVQWMAGIPNNGIGKVGVNWFLSTMPVRFRTGDVHNIDFVKQAAGLDYAVANNAPISAVWGGNNNYPQVMFDAVERAKLAGNLVIVPVGNDSSDLDVTPRFPPCLTNDNLISVTAFNANDGMDSVWNWGSTCVDLAGPTAPGGGTSGGAAHVAGVAALLKTVHPEWNYQQLKDRILSTVVPSAALAGKTVTGGRLNAANALRDPMISISDATATESGSGSASEAVFNVSLIVPNPEPVTVDYEIVSDTATAGADFVAGSGTITFAPGQITSAILVQTLDDALVEGTETFLINLSNPSGVTIADGHGLGMILDNDLPPTIDVVAAGETHTAGTVSGTHLATHAADNIVQTLTEERYSGNKRSRLEHSWRFDGVTSGDGIELIVAAYHLNNTGVETFSFAFSTNRTTWTTLGNLGRPAFVLPNNLSGSVYVRVTDTDRNNDTTLDQLAVDQLLIRSTTAGASSTSAPAAPSTSVAIAETDVALLVVLDEINGSITATKKRT